MSELYPGRIAVITNLNRKSLIDQTWLISNKNKAKIWTGRAQLRSYILGCSVNSTFFCAIFNNNNNGERERQSNINIYITRNKLHIENNIH